MSLWLYSFFLLHWSYSNTYWPALALMQSSIVDFLLWLSLTRCVSEQSKTSSASQYFYSQHFIVHNLRYLQVMHTWRGHWSDRAVWHLLWADHTSTAPWHDDLAAMVCCYGAYLCTSARADNWLEREHDVTSCTCKVRAFTDSKIVAIYSSEIWFDCHTNAVAFIGC